MPAPPHGRMTGTGTPNAGSALASALSGVASRMDPTEAARICGRPPRHSPKHSAVRRMPMPARRWRRRCRRCVGPDGTRPRPPASARSGRQELSPDALGRETDAECPRIFGIGAVGGGGADGPDRGRAICGQAAKTLAEALGRETDANARSSLASALSEVAGRMDPTEAARICGQAAKTLAEALGRETDAEVPARLGIGACDCVEAGWSRPRPPGHSPKHSGRETDAVPARPWHRRCRRWRAGWTCRGRTLCGQAAKTLAEALGRETDADARSTLASALSRWRAGWTRPRPHTSAARPPRYSPKHSAVRRMPVPARPWHRHCRRWRAGWTRPRPHASVAGVMRSSVKATSKRPQRAGRGMILHSCQDPPVSGSGESESPDP